MFIIDLRNKNVSDYRFSVINNNDVDEVKIFSSFTQYSDYSIYLKVESDDKTYADKFAISQSDIETDDDALVVKWLMSRVFTQFKKIYIQLQFEDGNGDKIAQSRIVAITLNDTINVSGHIEILYPDVLRDLQRQIDELKARVDELEGE